MLNNYIFNGFGNNTDGYPIHYVDNGQIISAGIYKVYNENIDYIMTYPYYGYYGQRYTGISESLTGNIEFRQIMSGYIDPNGTKTCYNEYSSDIFNWPVVYTPTVTINNTKYYFNSNNLHLFDNSIGLGFDPPSRSGIMTTINYFKNTISRAKSHNIEEIIDQYNQPLSTLVLSGNILSGNVFIYGIETPVADININGNEEIYYTYKIGQTNTKILSGFNSDSVQFLTPDIAVDVYRISGDAKYYPISENINQHEDQFNEFTFMLNSYSLSAQILSQPISYMTTFDDINYFTFRNISDPVIFSPQSIRFSKVGYYNIEVSNTSAFINTQAHATALNRMQYKWGRWTGELSGMNYYKNSSRDLDSVTLFLKENNELLNKANFQNLIRLNSQHNMGNTFSYNTCYKTKNEHLISAYIAIDPQSYTISI